MVVGRGGEGGLLTCSFSTSGSPDHMTIHESVFLSYASMDVMAPMPRFSPNSMSLMYTSVSNLAVKNSLKPSPRARLAAPFQQSLAASMTFTPSGSKLVPTTKGPSPVLLLWVMEYPQSALC